MMTTIGCSCRMSNECNALVRELQQIWTEIGETETDKERMLLELERDCLEMYRRKVDESINAKAHLHQSIVAKEAELAMLMAALGEINSTSLVLPEKKSKSLKMQLATVTPFVEDLKLKKEERVKQFADIKAQIEKITSEISGHGNTVSPTASLNLDEQDFSLRKLLDYQSNLSALQKKKSERFQMIVDYVNEIHTLSGVLGLDFRKTVSDVHPSLHGSVQEHFTNISDSTSDGLNHAIMQLKTERKIRFQKLKDVYGSLVELWKLMDTKHEEKINFLRITSILSMSESEIVQPGVLSMDILEQGLGEVERLNNLKASRLKELVLKKRAELEEECHKTHIRPDTSTAEDKINALIDSGLVDPSEILANIEAQIHNAREEALSRKEIMERIDRWLSACDEENWLEDYNQDENRYSAGRGAHINLKRAERARVTINKIPAMVNNLITQTLAWEAEKQRQFLYDGVHLVSILGDYKLTRLQKEEEKKRSRDHKKLQGMLLAEKEAIYGSKPSPRRSNSLRKINGFQTYGNGSITPSPRRSSVDFSTPDVRTPRTMSGRQIGYCKEMRRLSTAPLNFVAVQKEDTMSFSSVYGSEPESPPQS